VGHWWGDEYCGIIRYGEIQGRSAEPPFPSPVAYRSFEERDFALAAEARVGELFSFTKKTGQIEGFRCIRCLALRAHTYVNSTDQGRAR